MLLINHLVRSTINHLVRPITMLLINHLVRPITMLLINHLVRPITTLLINHLVRPITMLLINHLVRPITMLLINHLVRPITMLRINLNKAACSMTMLFACSCPRTSLLMCSGRPHSGLCGASSPSHPTSCLEPCPAPTQRCRIRGRWPPWVTWMCLL